MVKRMRGKYFSANGDFLLSFKHGAIKGFLVSKQKSRLSNIFPHNFATEETFLTFKNAFI